MEKLCQGTQFYYTLNASAFIPTSLKVFLKMLLVGESPVSGQVNILAESAGQDTVYGITHANVKPSKQIMLSNTVK